MQVIRKTDKSGKVRLPDRWGIGVEKIEMKEEKGGAKFLMGKKVSGGGKTLKTPWKEKYVVILEYGDRVEIWEKEIFEKWKEKIKKEEGKSEKLWKTIKKLITETVKKI